MYDLHVFLAHLIYDRKAIPTAVNLSHSLWVEMEGCLLSVSFLYNFPI